MTARLLRLLRRVLVLVLVAVGAIVGLRAWDSQRGPPLEVWHTYVPHDLHAADIDKIDSSCRRYEAQSILSMSAACRSFGT